MSFKCDVLFEMNAETGLGLFETEAQDKGFSPFSLISSYVPNKGRKIPREQSSTLGDVAKVSLRSGDSTCKSDDGCCIVHSDGTRG